MIKNLKVILWKRVSTMKCRMMVPRMKDADTNIETVILRDKVAGVKFSRVLHVVVEVKLNN